MPNDPRDRKGPWRAENVLAVCCHGVSHSRWMEPRLGVGLVRCGGKQPGIQESSAQRASPSKQDSRAVESGGHQGSPAGIRQDTKSSKTQVLQGGDERAQPTSVSTRERFKGKGTKSHHEHGTHRLSYCQRTHAKLHFPNRKQN